MLVKYDPSPMYCFQTGKKSQRFVWMSVSRQKVYIKTKFFVRFDTIFQTQKINRECFPTKEEQSGEKEINVSMAEIYVQLQSSEIYQFR